LPGEILGDAFLVDLVGQVSDPEIPRLTHHVVTVRVQLASNVSSSSSRTTTSDIVSGARLVDAPDHTTTWHYNLT